MATLRDRLKETFKALSPTKVGEYIQDSQIYRSIFRVGVPDSDRKRMLVMLGSVFLHLHPVKVRKSGIRMRYTWCMGGITFFLFLVLTFTGLLLMFYYRPTLEYAYVDIRDLREQVPLGIMREIHRWGAHAMVIAVWLHMYRVFMTGSYKPPREFNWNVGVILLVLTLLLSFTGYLLPWDQLAIWAITVGSNMARATPLLGYEGPGSKFLAVGGVELIHSGSDARFLLLGGRFAGQTALLPLHAPFPPAFAAWVPRSRRLDRGADQVFQLCVRRFLGHAAIPSGYQRAGGRLGAAQLRSALRRLGDDGQ